MTTPVRVLHVLGGLGRGGAETWLVQLIARLDRDRVQTDVAVLNASEGLAYRQNTTDLGCAVHACANPSRPWAFAADLSRILRALGPYDAIHVHAGPVSGAVVAIARICGVPIRIVHSRNSADGHADSPMRNAYRTAMRSLIRRNATHLLAVSSEAAVGLFGEDLAMRCELMTGFEFSAFGQSVDRGAVRRSMGIADGAKVLGHVASFTAKKNHELLVEIAAELARSGIDVAVLSVGSGQRREKIEALVRERGLTNVFHFLGDRGDVPSLMMGAMDALVLTSFFEGLPRVLVEAQAAGLPCVASDAVTKEAAASDGAVRFVPLDASAAKWAEAIIDALSCGRSPERGAAAIAAFGYRGMTIEANARLLEQLYVGQAPRGAQ